jgi:hypothetical protein
MFFQVGKWISGSAIIQRTQNEAKGHRANRVRTSLKLADTPNHHT